MSKKIVEFINKTNNEAGKRIEFENTWRYVINKKYGAIRYAKNQPGVEFYKVLTEDINELGKNNQWIGWQCKWFDTNNAKLEPGHIQQIKNSIRTTKEHLPEITRWYLCTPQTLATDTQRKIESVGKEYGMEILFWDGEILDDIASSISPISFELLSGEFTIDREELDKLLDRKTMRADPTWSNIPHIKNKIETLANEVLGEDCFRLCSKQINEIKALLKKSKNTLDKTDYHSLEILLGNIDKLEHPGTWSNKDLLTKTLSNSASYRFLYNFIRKYQYTEISSNVKKIVNKFVEVNDIIAQKIEFLKTNFISIIGKAGTGKTNTIISIVNGNKHRLPGILTFAKDLSESDTVDSFFQKHVKFESHNSIKCFSDLLNALELVGIKSDCRIPIVIDAINESPYQKQWKDLLIEISQIIKNYSRIVLIYTSRDKINLPHTVMQLNTKMFTDWEVFKNRYFEHFKIKHIGPKDYFLPEDFPLAIRLFCEHTNKSRDKTVTVQSIDWQVSYYLEDKIDTVINNLANNKRVDTTIDAAYVRKILIRIGALFLKSKGLPISKLNLLKSLKEISSDVNDVTLELLKSEDLLTINVDDEDRYSVDIAYQRLGGFLIANFLIERKSIAQFSETALLDEISSHQWSEDIWLALTYLFHKRKQLNLFHILPKDYRHYSLEHIAKIDKKYISSNRDVDLIHKYLSKLETTETLSKTREVWLEPGHPCNFNCVSNLLSKLSFSELNLKWCEYIRKNEQWFSQLLLGINNNRPYLEPPVEKILLNFLPWIFSSTHLEFPTQSYYILLQIGKKDPANFLSEITQHFKNIDQRILEYLLCCGYSASLYAPTTEKLQNSIKTIISEARNTFLNPQSNNFTSNIVLLRIIHLFETRLNKLTGNVPKPFEVNSMEWPYGASKNESLYDEFIVNNIFIKSTLLEDLEFHLESQTPEQIVWHLLGRVADLGWSEKKFKEIDNAIRDNSSRCYSINQFATYFQKYFSTSAKEFIGILPNTKIFPKTPRPYIEYPKEIKLTTHALTEKNFPDIDWHEGIMHLNLSSLEKALTEQLEGIVDSTEWKLVHAHFNDSSIPYSRNLYAHFKSFLVNTAAITCADWWYLTNYPGTSEKYLCEGPDLTVPINNKLCCPFLIEFKPIGEKDCIFLDASFTKKNFWKFNFEDFSYYQDDKQMTKYIFTTWPNSSCKCEFLFIRRNWLTDFLKKEGLFLLHSCLVENNKCPNVRDEWRSVVHFSI